MSWDEKVEKRIPEDGPLPIVYSSDWTEEMEKRVPEDGTLEIVPFDPDLYKDNNIMIIKIPDHMRTPDGPFFQVATIDRSIPGNDFDGNRTLDKLIPDLPKVTVFEKPESDDDSPSLPRKKSIPRRKFAKPRQASSNVEGDADFSVKSIPVKLYPGIPKDTLLKEPRPKDDTLPPKQHVPKQGLIKNVKTRRASYSNAGPKFKPHYYKEQCPKKSNRLNPDDIHPWITENEHFIPIGNTHFSTISSGENYLRNLVGNTVNDHFVPNRENYLLREYPHNPGSFGDVLPLNYSVAFGNGLPLNYSSSFGDVLPPPNYPKGTGLLGDHPPNFNPCKEKDPHNSSSFGDATSRPPPYYFGAFGNDLPSNFSGAFDDVLRPNYSGAFGDVLPPNYSDGLSDVCPPLKYQSGIGILGHHPPTFNSADRYFSSHNPNLSADYPLKNYIYQEVPRFDRMEYRNLNPRDDRNQNQFYRRKKDFLEEGFSNKGPSSFPM